MNVLPVIERELRAEARHPTTQWFRPLGAAVALGMAALALVGSPTNRQPGPELFSTLHQLLFVTIWLLVPLITADCVSREKREQTLGLLFLTPLRAAEIIAAKTLVHGLRAAAVCVAIVPVLILPLLIGGVSWYTVVSSLLINASAFLWALAAGLTASVLSRSIVSGLVWSMIWAAVFLVILALLEGLAIQSIALGRGVRPDSVWLAGMGLLALWQKDQILESLLLSVPPSTQLHWLLSGAGIVLVSFLGLITVGLIAAWRLKQAWQELPPSPQREKVARQFARPRIAIGLFKAAMRRHMERNPVGWLERRRWTSRAALWGWLGALSIAYTIVFTEFTHARDLDSMTRLVGLALVGVLALVSAASFRRERETGVMELLLTTPLSPGQIVRGRLRGIWTQFLPSLLLFVFITMFSATIMGEYRWRGRLMNDFANLADILAFFLAVPVAGLWFSLYMRSYMASLLMTALLMGVIPLVLMNLSHGGNIPPAAFAIPLGVIFGIWGLLTLRSSLGWPMTIVLMGLLAVFVQAMLLTDGPRTMRQVWPGFGLRVLLPCLQLGLAGLAHRWLLRHLRDRRFAFQV